MPTFLKHTVCWTVSCLKPSEELILPTSVHTQDFVHMGQLAWLVFFVKSLEAKAVRVAMWRCTHFLVRFSVAPWRNNFHLALVVQPTGLRFARWALDVGRACCQDF
jgi:hypothetical protein